MKARSLPEQVDQQTVHPAGTFVEFAPADTEMSSDLAAAILEHRLAAVDPGPA